MQKPGDFGGEQPVSGVPVVPGQYHPGAPAGNEVDDFQARIDALKNGGGGGL